MARTDAQHLEILLTARDTISDALAAGDRTVKYVTGVGDTRREHEVTPSIARLKSIEDMIEHYEQRVARSTSGGGINYARFGGSR